MSFASPTFLFLFLPGCVAAYFACRGTASRNVLLLTASWLFYAWGEPIFVLLLIGMTVFNYAMARMVCALDGARRRHALAAGIVVDLAVLGYFKYAAFTATNLNLAFASTGWSLGIPQVPLPLGVSFFTLQAISYLIDVHRRRVAVDRDPIQVALYLAFFPQLIAGPIVRYSQVGANLRRRHHTLGRASAGLRIFVIGLAQKLLIADLIAPVADAVFDHARHPGLAESWLGAVSYALQIYFDFAGYSNMAVGLGVLFGFRLPRNFRRPYASVSMTEFWRRWHISLSTWFRDYLYIPLGGSRRGGWRTARNLVVVFLLCGLWHGPSWTFVLWGAWHGAFLVVERLLRRFQPPPRVLGWCYAFAATTVGWVLFRSADLGHAADIWRGMAGLNGNDTYSRATATAIAPIHSWLIPLAGLLAIVPLHRLRLGLASVRMVWADTVTVGMLLTLCVLEVSTGTSSPFLYFRF